MENSRIISLLVRGREGAADTQMLNSQFSIHFWANSQFSIRFTLLFGFPYHTNKRVNNGENIHVQGDCLQLSTLFSVITQQPVVFQNFPCIHLFTRTCE